MANLLTFSNSFSCMNTDLSLIKFHWKLFPMGPINNTSLSALRIDIMFSSIE